MSTPRHDLASAFRPTFTGGRLEKRWLRESLGGFYVDEWFTDILFRVKGGKEATVYCCQAHPATGHELIAAKVFRPRIFRAMKNDSLYKTGRLIKSGEGKYPDERTARALKKRSAYGLFLDSYSWCQHEVSMLETLYAAGVNVPRVLTSSPNAILMEFVGDEVMGAPILHAVTLERDEAQALYEGLIEDVRRMLQSFVVHADLSAYNVLYWDGEARIIDLPQAIDALRHPQGYELFARDIERLATYFRRQGVDVDAPTVAFDLWQAAYG